MQPLVDRGMNQSLTKEHKRISIIMAVYWKDDSASFEQALKSIYCEQEMRPDEIVLVKNGPLTVELDEVIENTRVLMEGRLVVIENTENKGLPTALNQAIQHAQGEFLARMDADDVSTPDRLQKQYNFLQTHPGVDVLGGALNYVDKNGDGEFVRTYPLEHSEMIDYFHKASPLAHGTVMMRAKVFKKIRYDERHATSQDLALWFDLVSAGYKLANLPDVIYTCFWDDDFYRRRSWRRAWSEFGIYISGIRRLHGVFSWRYIFPIARLLLRLVPIKLSILIYKSNIKQQLLNRKKAAGHGA